MQFDRILIVLIGGCIILSSCEKRQEAASSSPQTSPSEETQAAQSPKKSSAVAIISPWNFLTQISDQLAPSSRDAALCNMAITAAAVGNVPQALALTQRMSDEEKMKTLQGIAQTLLDAQKISQAAEIIKTFDAENQKPFFYDMSIALAKSDDFPRAFASANRLEGNVKTKALFAIVDVITEKGDIPRAKEFFSSASATSTSNTNSDFDRAETLTIMGGSLLKMGNKNRAMECFSQALTFADKLQDAEKTAVLQHLASAYASVGDTVQAVYLINRINDQTAGDAAKASAFNEVAFIVAEKDNLQNAIALTNKVEGIYRVDALYKIALISIKKGDKQGAAELLSQTLMFANQLQEPRKTDFLLAIASALVKSDNLQQALGIAEQFQDREKVWALIEIAKALKDTGDRKRGIEILEQALNVPIAQKDGEQIRMRALCDIADALVKIDISENNPTFSPDAQKLAAAILAPPEKPKKVTPPEFF